MSTIRAVVLIACAVLAVAFANSGRQDGARPAGEQIQIPAGKENLPAEQVFKNIEILKGKPALRLPGMMKALNGLLGVECTHCHVAGAWEREEPEAKRTARRMFKMIDNVSQKYFDGKNEITCWTCHRGGPKPSNGGAEIGAAMAKLPAERRQVIAALVDILGTYKDKPAEEVFRDIQVLNGMSAERVVRVMSVFTVALGVDCSHCHVADQWDDEHPAKEIAREMLRMVRGINQQFFEGQAKVACWTCHRGAAKPEAMRTRWHGWPADGTAAWITRLARFAKTEEITSGEDLATAKAQSETMAKAKLSVAAATTKAVSTTRGYRAVRRFPRSKKITRRGYHAHEGQGLQNGDGKTELRRRR